MIEVCDKPGFGVMTVFALIVVVWGGRCVAGDTVCGDKRVVEVYELPGGGDMTAFT